MLRNTVKTLLSPRQKRYVRGRLNAFEVWLATTFRPYQAPDLVAALRQAGIGQGDTVMVHANFPPTSGFRGSPRDLVDALVESVGAGGNLMMVSIPFRGFARDYLAAGKTFNVRKTVSMMGLATEIFRRRDDVVRSLHPTHPVVIAGPDRERIAAGHERSLYPTGEDTPFARLCELDGKILLLDLGFGALTLFHYVEHLLRRRLPFELYDPQLFSASVIDAAGNAREVKTYAFAANVRRHQDRLGDEMQKRGLLVRRRIGNSQAIVARARDVVATMTEMIERGVPLLEARTH